MTQEENEDTNIQVPLLIAYVDKTNFISSVKKWQRKWFWGEEKEAERTKVDLVKTERKLDR